MIPEEMSLFPLAGARVKMKRSLMIPGNGTEKHGSRYSILICLAEIITVCAMMNRGELLFYTAAEFSLEFRVREQQTPGNGTATNGIRLQSMVHPDECQLWSMMIEEKKLF